MYELELVMSGACFLSLEKRRNSAQLITLVGGFCEVNILEHAWHNEGACFVFKTKPPWDFPGGPVVKTALSRQGTWVQSLVRELRSHMLCYQKIIIIIIHLIISNDKK